MKHFLLLALSLLLTNIAFSQSQSYTKDVSMSLGTLPALVVDLEEIDVKTATTYWTDYIKEYGKLKKNKRAKELYAEGVRIPLLKATKMDLFSKVEDLKGSSRVYLWLDEGGSFLSEENNADLHAKAKKFMDDFAVSAEKQHVESLLKTAEKDLKKFEKDMKGLGKDKTSYEKSIEDAKKKIADNEKKIEENTVAQESKAIEIDAQKSLVEKIKDRLGNVGKGKTKM